MALELLGLLLSALLGLAIGSFFNVLIYRLPIMIERSWQENDNEPTFNLAFPASHCPKCQHPIAWYDNIPLLSFAFLRGGCRHCNSRISWQYPLVEWLTALLFVWCWLHYPSWEAALAWALFASALLALAIIDARTTWLPDAITQPLTWGGLVATAAGWTGLGLPESLAGAVIGYLSLWTLYWVFLLITGKEGMGHGDFKLLAALGAWFGWKSLLAMVLIASISGLLMAFLVLRRKPPENQQMPFGPYLAVAGFWHLFFGTPHLLTL